MKNKVCSILIVFVFLISGICIIHPFNLMLTRVEATSSWTETSDTDFNNGTLNNVEIDGLGSTAELSLIGNFSGNWTLKPRGDIPDSRRAHVMASIHGTDKILLFGGYKGGLYYDDTWLYDLSNNNWTEMKPSSKPTGRHSHAMATIYGTDNVLLFGGYSSGGLSNETWVYNLSTNTWSNKNPSGNKPSAREYHAMASVYNDDKVVLFSGSNGSSYFNDTWVYDLNQNSWTNQSPLSAPSPRKGHEMANIYKTKEIFLFGGNETGTKLVNDTWVYNLTINTWSNKNPSGNNPSARRGHGTAAIDGTKKIMLFGLDDQTWVYDSTTNSWSKKSPVAKPKGRYIAHGIAPIYGQDKALLFSGGYNSGGWIHLDDTWIFDLSANNWTNKTSFMTKPSARRGHVLSSIHGTNELLLFGGWDGWYLGDTWLYNLSSDKWTDMDPLTKPSGRHSFAMASIYGMDQVLLFGGVSSGGVNNETWVYDLSDNNWTQKSPQQKPEAREYHAMASVYDEDMVVLFSGYNGTGYINDTWIYDLSGNTWIEKLPLTAPTPRKGHEMANVYGTKKIVLFGGNESGNNEINDTWIYDLTANSWIKKSIAMKPSVRRGHGMAAIDGTDKVMIFGSDDQTWLYDLSNNTWSQKTPTSKPKARYITHGLAAVYGINKAVLFGGGSSGGDLDDTWIYDAVKYVKSGNYISTAYDMGANSTPKILSWKAITPPSTSIKFQLRSATNKSGLSLKNFVGPSGIVAGYYTTPPANIWSGHSNDIWIQYKAYFSSTTEDRTPILKEVTITFNNLSQALLLGPPDDAIISDNQPTFEWDFGDEVGSTQTAFHLIIDNDKEFISIDFDSGEQASTEHSWAFPTGTSYYELPDGLWYWKVRTKDIDDDWGPYSPPFKIIIDTKVPTSTLTFPLDNGFYNEINTITGTAIDTEDGSGISKVEVVIKRLIDELYWNGSDWQTIQVWLLVSGTIEWSYDTSGITWTSGDHYSIKSRAYDNADNFETSGIEHIVTFDSAKPSSVINYPLDDCWLNNLNTIKGSSKDIDGSGINKVDISIEDVGKNYYWTGTSWDSGKQWLTTVGTGSWSFDTSTIEWNSDTEYLIQSKAIDISGNVENPSTGISFIYDDTSPKNFDISINNDDEYTNSRETTLYLIKEGSESESLLMSFSTNGIIWTAWEQFSPTKSYTLSEGDGEKIVYLRVQDLAGNEPEPVFDSIILDTIPPEDVLVVINNNVKYTNHKEVVLSLNAFDKLSGVSEMSFSFEGNTWTSWEPYDVQKSIEIPNGDGNKIVYFRVRDKMDNIATAYDIIIMDTQPPKSLYLQINNGATETDSTIVDLNLSAIDTHSTVHKMSFSTDGEIWTTWEKFSETKTFDLPAGDGTKTIYFRVKDRAGNIADPIEATIIKITDTDLDGVPDNLDAFPTDAAASIDSDGDNYPDAWNPGKSELDTTTGLQLDAYPFDEDKQLNIKESPKGAPDDILIVSLSIIFLIIIFTIIIFAIFVFKKRKSSPRLNDSERTLTDLKHEVLHGENKQELDLTGTELRALYEKNYAPGELSDEVTEYINNIIEERD